MYVPPVIQSFGFCFARRLKPQTQIAWSINLPIQCQLGSLTGDQRPYSDQIQTLKSYFVFPVTLLSENSPRRRFSVFTISNKSLSMSNKLFSMSNKLFSMLEVLNSFYYNHSVSVYETCSASLSLQGLWWSVSGLPKLLSLSHGWYNTCMIKISVKDADVQDIANFAFFLFSYFRKGRMLYIFTLSVGRSVGWRHH